MAAKDKNVADDLYEKIAAVSAENKRLKTRLKQVWVRAIEGQNGAGEGGGAVAWRDALIEIEALAK